MKQTSNYIITRNQGNKAFSILKKLIIVAMISLNGCTRSQPNELPPTIKLAPRETNMLESALKTSTPTLESTNTPERTTTSQPFKTATITLTPDYFETEFPEPTVIYHLVMTPTAPLDPKSYRSVLDWIKFSFANQDLSIIEGLTLETVHFGISEAEFTDDLTKDELIKTLTVHLAQGTQCLAYTFRDGEINSLDIFMANWEPNWEYGGRRTNDLIFHFNDQFTPDSGLSLYAVAVPYAIDQYYVAEIFDHMCFE
jgi:predicted small lipoprotein YifL